MNRIKRLGITLLMVLTILIQAVITYGIPNEVVGKTYIEIPVKFKGDITSMISAYVRKAQTTGNANELFDISGYVIFDIKAYAYETGSEVKVGAEITYKDKDGNTQKDWWDNVEQLNKSAIGWPSCSGYFITVQDNIRFVEPYQNKTELRIMLEMKGKNSGFSRATNHGVSLSQNAPDPVSADEYPKVQLQTINRHNQTVNNYSVVFDVNGTQQKEIFPSPLSLEPGAKVAVTIAGKKLDKQQYQVIASQPEPVIPAKDNNGWKSLGDIPKVLPNTKEAYPDLIDRAGYISTRHYNYKYNSTQYGSGSIPPRAETFDYPIGKNLVIQKSNLDSQKQYHSIEEKSAFFDKSNIGKTVMDAVYIPTESGQYQFGVYSNSGAYGYIIVDGNQKTIVNDLNANSGNATYHSSNTTLTLTANKKYTIHMEWEQKTSDHIAPRLQYKKKNGNSWGAAQIVPNTCFEDERYVGGGNKAVKFWGYIIPDQTGDYH
ncbi:MAG: hypothetical protein K0S30_880, partial [Clostridia bacterium]|nr:hypothetical protein [Clostridia bacterium]